jgi:sugar phosphate permease
LSGVVFLFGLTCLATSKVSGLVTLFFAFLFLRMCAQGAMGLIATNTNAMWFRRKLGTVVGIQRVAGSLVIGVIPLIHIWLIGKVGWRMTYAILGLSVWIIMGLILLILFRNRPESVGALPDGDTIERYETEIRAGDTKEINFTPGQALRTRAYWIMAVAGSMWSMIGTGIQFNIQPIFIEHGFTDQDAMTWFLVLSISGSIMFLIAGLLADRLRLTILLSVSFLGMVTAILVTIYFKSLLVGYSSAFAFGIGHSFSMTTQATLYVRYYGREHLGKIQGVVATILGASSASGPFVMGFLNDLFGGYGISLWVFVAIASPMVMLSFLATQPKSPQHV